MNLAVIVVAVFFAGMGIAALVKPAFIWAPFGVAPTTPAARNEVRAVYGGFGLALAALLFVADSQSAGFRDGVLVAVAVALAGMAVGRLLGALVEPRPLLGWPGIFFLIETALAVLLLIAR
ncbi:hypothetical protein GCM10009745_16550 [Kribbella yunnanensis]|uniref:Major facilitator superfamily (MFS) profile domain-containing protein n=1 Tax=Kribbella yunnanensis TaxID=190194 RepID=A0ABN2GNH0_9ACTN